METEKTVFSLHWMNFLTVIRVVKEKFVAMKRRIFDSLQTGITGKGLHQRAEIWMTIFTMIAE